MKFQISVSVVKTYTLQVEAETDEAAIEQVEEMQTTAIERLGSLTNCETEAAEVLCAL